MRAGGAGPARRDRRQFVTVAALRRRFRQYAERWRAERAAAFERALVEIEESHAKEIAKLERRARRVPPRHRKAWLAMETSIASRKTLDLMLSACRDRQFDERPTEPRTEMQRGVYAWPHEHYRDAAELWAVANGGRAVVMAFVSGAFDHAVQARIVKALHGVLDEHVPDKRARGRGLR